MDDRLTRVLTGVLALIVSFAPLGIMLWSELPEWRKQLLLRRIRRLRARKRDGAIVLTQEHEVLIWKFRQAIERYSREGARDNP